MVNLKKSTWMVAVFIGAIISVGLLVLPPALWGQAKPVVWNLPHVSAPSHYIGLNYKAFVDKVKEKSNGRFEIRFHPASSLYPSPQLIPAVVEGRVEIAPVLTSYLVDLFLPMGVLELPFMTRSIEEHWQASKKLRSFYAEQFAPKGLLLMTVHPWPSQQLLSTKKAIAKVENWKGVKVRTQGSEFVEVTKALGGAPVYVAFGELYTALQRGVVDGAITSATNVEPMKFFEVIKHLNYWYINGASIEFLAVNKKAWDALSPDLQKIFNASLKEVRFEDKMWEDAIAWDLRAKKRLPELGVTVNDISGAEIDKAKKLSKVAWENWIKRTGPEGRRGFELALKALGK